MRKKTFWGVFGGFLFLMTLLMVFGQNGLLHVVRLKGELERLTNMNETMALKNALLREDINHLRNHEGYIEQKAHELGLVKENEIIFQFRGDQ
jgi:cell division protein FtsB